MFESAPDGEAAMLNSKHGAQSKTMPGPGSKSCGYTCSCQ